MSDIAITATGVVSAAGIGTEPVLRAMAEGVCLMKSKQADQTSNGRPPWPVAEVRPDDVHWPTGGRWIDFRKYANFAAHQAVTVARQAVDREMEENAAVRSGTVMAVSSSGADELGEVMPRLAVLAEEDPRPLAKLLYDEVPDYSYVRGIPSQLGQFVSMATGFRGSNVAVYGETGAGGFGALDIATRLIDSGELDRVLVVGVAPPLSTVAMIAFDRQESLGTDAVPGRGPFDAGRTGTFAGQGAVAILLERADLTRARGGDVLTRLSACRTICATDRRKALDHALQPVLETAGYWLVR